MDAEDHYSWYISEPIKEERWVYCDNAFTPVECEQIIDMYDPNHKGILLGEANKWIFARITGITQQINRDFYNYDLTKIDYIEIQKHCDTDHHPYPKKLDIMENTTLSRKLTVSIVLSDTDEFQGGDHIIYEAELPDLLKREKSCAIFFPSWTIHQITPVTKGTRYSLNTWISGPRFK